MLFHVLPVDHIADRECAGNGKFEAVALAEIQPAGTARDLRATDLRDPQPDYCAEVDVVADEA